MPHFFKKYATFFIFFLVFLFSEIQAQTLSLPSQDLKKNIEQIILQEINFKKDTVALQYYLAPLKKADSKRFHVLYSALVANGYSNFFDRINNKSDHYYLKSIQDAQKINDPSLVVWTQLNYSKYLYYYREMDQLTPVLLKTIESTNSINPDKLLLPGETFKIFGWIMLTIEDIDLAKTFLEKALANTLTSSPEYACILNSIGHCYFKKDDLPKAIKYYNKAETLSLQNGDTIRYAKVLGDKALIFEKKGDLKSAIQLLKKDITYSQKLKNEKNEMYASILLVKILLKEQEIKQANEVLQRAEKIAQSKSYYKSSLMEVIELKLVLLNGKNPEKELLLRRQLNTLSQYLLTTDGNSALSRSNWMVQKTKYEHEVKTAQLAAKEQAKMNKIYVLIIGLIALLFFFIYVSMKKRLKTKGLEYDKRVMKHEIDKLTYEKQLNEAKQNLNAHVYYLQNKNIQISKLKFELEEIKTSSLKGLEEDKGKLQALLDSHLMTDENWGAFKREFIKEHDEFYKTLTESFPELKDSNLKIIMLQKLEFGNSEMATLLGVTVDAIKKSKQRLKKKLGDKQDLLFEILDTV